MSRAPETQLESFVALQEKLGPILKRVLEVIEAGGYEGATLFEIRNKLDWDMNCVSGRVRDLVKMGLVVDSGNKRRNPRTNLRGIVWVKK